MGDICQCFKKSLISVPLCDKRRKILEQMRVLGRIWEIQPQSLQTGRNPESNAALLSVWSRAETGLGQARQRLPYILKEPIEVSNRPCFLWTSILCFKGSQTQCLGNRNDWCVCAEHSFNSAVEDNQLFYSKIWWLHVAQPGWQKQKRGTTPMLDSSEWNNFSSVLSKKHLALEDKLSMLWISEHLKPHIWWKCFLWLFSLG